jgi:hypothetical protein
MRLFAQIRKVDEAKRLVIARAVQEVADHSGEIFDYRTSRPYFEEWSKSQFDASGGKSYGNVRAMHGKIAAGIVAEPLAFSDTDKAIDVAIKVTDDQEWAKCNDGTYTGLSIGGSYVGDRITEKAADGQELKRYTAKPAEISLVDSPCIPTARFFEVVKADGATEQREFKAAGQGSGDAGNTGAAAPAIQGTAEEVDALCRAMAGAGLAVADVISYAEVERMLMTGDELAKREFSADERKQAAKEGQALPDGSFPIKNKSDLANAVKAYGRAKDKAAAKAHIVKRAKSLGATDMLPDSWKKGDGEKAAGGELKKNLWNVQSFAECLGCLANVARSAESDADYEGDNSPVPAAIRNAFAELVDAFKAMASEEADECLAELKAHAGVGEDDEIEYALEAAAKAGALIKRLADPELSIVELAKLAEEHLSEDERKALKTPEAVKAAVLAKAGKVDKAKLQEIHDHAASMGADCAGEKAAPTGDLAKMTATIAEKDKRIDELATRVKKLEDQPVPHVLLRTIPKDVRKTDNPAPEGTPGEVTILSLKKEDYVYNGDGSIDWAASLLQKRMKVASAA